MSDSPDLILSLLAIRLHGGEGVPKSLPVLKAKDVAAGLKVALRDGLVEEFKTKVPAEGLTKSGKPKTKTLTLYRLTDSGASRLQSLSDPAARGASQSAALAALKEGLAADRVAMREQIEAALASPQKGKGSLAELAKCIADLASRIDRIEVSLRDGALGRLDQVFDRMSGKIDELLAGVTAAGVGEQARRVPSQESRLRGAIEEAYKELSYRVEFSEGLVDLPRLYYKVRAAVPDVTLEDFHAEVRRMWDERLLHLHIANEIHKIPENEKPLGIWYNDRFFFYVQRAKP